MTRSLKLLACVKTGKRIAAYVTIKDPIWDIVMSGSLLYDLLLFCRVATGNGTLDLLADPLRGKIKLIALLKIHPECGFDPEPLLKALCGVCRHCPLE